MRRLSKALGPSPLASNWFVSTLLAPAAIVASYWVTLAFSPWAGAVVLLAPFLLLAVARDARILAGYTVASVLGVGVAFASGALSAGDDAAPSFACVAIGAGTAFVASLAPHALLRERLAAWSFATSAALAVSFALLLAMFAREGIAALRSSIHGAIAAEASEVVAPACPATCTSSARTPAGHQRCDAVVTTTAVLTVARECGGGATFAHVSRTLPAAPPGSPWASSAPAREKSLATDVLARTDMPLTVRLDSATDAFVVSQGGAPLRGLNSHGAVLLDEPVVDAASGRLSQLGLSIGAALVLVAIALASKARSASIAERALPQAIVGAVIAQRFRADDSSLEARACTAADGPALAFGRLRHRGYRDGGPLEPSVRIVSGTAAEVQLGLRWARLRALSLALGALGAASIAIAAEAFSLLAA